MTSVPQSKKELELAINSTFSKLMIDYHSIPEKIARECGVEGNVRGTKISVCDTAAYLIGWGRLVLKWYKLKSQGQPVDLPEKGYNWNQLGLLANKFHDEYSNWKYAQLLEELEHTVHEVLELVGTLSNQDLYETPWYRKWPLGRMIQFNTVSPMKNMRTKIRRFAREQKLT